MQLHSSLVPLIEEHQRLLEACRKSKKDAAGASQHVMSEQEKLDFVVTVFKAVMVPHLQKEDHVFELCMGHDPEIDHCIKALMEEHHHISKMYSRLMDSNQLDEDLHNLATSLEEHINKENDKIYPMIQERLPFILDNVKY